MNVESEITCYPFLPLSFGLSLTLRLLQELPDDRVPFTVLTL